MAAEFIQVPVPTNRLQEVYELLARPRAVNSQVEGSQPGHGIVNGEIRWPEDLLLRAYRESPPAMRVVFDHLAGNPGRQVKATELTKAIATSLDRPDYQRDQLAGVLGAFGRRWANRYGRGDREHGAWPFHGEWSPDSGMYEYVMSAEVAQVFARAAKDYQRTRG